MGNVYGTKHGGRQKLQFTAHVADGAGSYFFRVTGALCSVLKNMLILYVSTDLDSLLCAFSVLVLINIEQ